MLLLKSMPPYNSIVSLKVLLVTVNNSNQNQKKDRFTDIFIVLKTELLPLPEVSYYINESIERGGQVDVIFTDISKVFDTVDHEHL